MTKEHALSDSPWASSRRGPIFIIGAMGSGTTLMRLVLDSHEHIAIPRETGFMRAYDAHRFTPFKYTGRNWTKRLGWSPTELDEVMRDLYDRLFMRYAEKHGKRRWGEKTPLHTWHIDDMARVFPDAQFVAMVRHPCASVSSNMTRFGMRMGRSASHWDRYVAEIARQAARHGDRFALIRYEDFVLRPEPVMRELLDWLGEPWSDVVLEHHVVHGARAPERVEGKSRSDEPIDVSRIAKWQRTLGRRRRSWLAERLGRQAELFGYDMDRADAEPLPDGRVLMLGTELDAHIERFADLDWRTQGEVPRYEQHYDPHRFLMVGLDEYSELTRARGLRRLGVTVTQALPTGGRQRVINVVRTTRRRLGLRRQPKRPRYLG